VAWLRPPYISSYRLAKGDGVPQGGHAGPRLERLAGDGVFFGFGGGHVALPVEVAAGLDK